MSLANPLWGAPSTRPPSALFFVPSEIRQLVAFYRTPAAQKFMDKSPVDFKRLIRRCTDRCEL
jgi:hypothetical protein